MVIIKKIKLLIKVLLRKDLLVRKEVNLHCERFGSDYGGWYVAPDFLSKESVVYSFGVGEDVTFDLALVDRFGFQVQAFDPTPRSIQWFREQDLASKILLNEYGLGREDGSCVFYPPKNERNISHSAIQVHDEKRKGIELPLKKLSTIMASLGNHSIDLLKMDIEGSEYEVIEGLAQTNVRPGQILIEFHHRFSSIGLDKTKQALKTLKSIGYNLYAVSATNEEYSFIHDNYLNKKSQ